MKNYVIIQTQIHAYMNVYIYYASKHITGTYTHMHTYMYKNIQLFIHVHCTIVYCWPT